MVKVTIGMGRHTMKIPHGMKKLFVDTIKSLGIEKGNFEVHLGENKKGSAFQQGIKFIELLPEFCTIRVKAQTAEKSGMHLCSIKFPGMYKGNELARFAELLQNKFGKAELEENDFVDSVVASPEVEIESKQSGTAKVLGSIPLAELNHKEKPTDDILILVLDEIFTARGTSWTAKKEFFSIVRSTGVNYPEDKMVGVFLQRGYLEPNPAKPRSSSRLTPLACKLIGKDLPVNDKSDSVDVIIDKKDAYIKRIKEIAEWADTHCAISNEMRDLSLEIEALNAEDESLVTELSRITELLEKNRDEIRNKEEKMLQAQAKITPDMIEAVNVMKFINV